MERVRRANLVALAFFLGSGCDEEEQGPAEGEAESESVAESVAESETEAESEAEAESEGESEAEAESEAECEAGALRDTSATGTDCTVDASACPADYVCRCVPPEESPPCVCALWCSDACDCPPDLACKSDSDDIESPGVNGACL